MRGDGFLRNFCVCALAGGIYMGIRQTLRGGDVGFAIGAGVFGGVVLGLIGAVYMAFIYDKVDDLVEMTCPDGEWPEVDVRERITLPLPADQARAACVGALQADGRFTAVRGAPASGMVHARARLSWESAGERIECRVRPVEAGSQVELRSRPLLRTTLVDWGKNRENVDRIRTALQSQAGPSALAAPHRPEAEAPVPAPGRVEPALHLRLDAGS